MNNQTQEALKMAIDEIQDLMQHIKDKQPDMLFTGSEYVINACKEALATTEDSSVVQPVQEPIYIYDLEAIAWALDKLANFGVTNNSADNALMADRLQMMLYQAPLEQPAQEPYCWTVEQKNGLAQGSMCRTIEECKSSPLFDAEIDHIIPLYTNPHQWQGLTDEEIQNITWKIWGADALEPELDYAHAIEQALKEKNT